VVRVVQTGPPAPHKSTPIRSHPPLTVSLSPSGVIVIAEQCFASSAFAALTSREASCPKFANRFRMNASISSSLCALEIFITCGRQCKLHGFGQVNRSAARGLEYLLSTAEPIRNDKDVRIRLPYSGQ
jgi:hypothetical protein